MNTCRFLLDPPAAEGGIMAVTVSKSVDNSTPDTGTNVIYTLVIKNVSPLATTVSVVDTLPSQVTYTGVWTGVEPTPAGQVLSWSLGSMTPQQTITLTYQVSADTAGTATNDAIVTFTEGNSSDSVTITIIQIPTLCAVMGKELACENLAGTARIVWCTTVPADQTVYISTTSASGPWVQVHQTLSPLTQCHDITTPLLVLGQHWFYVTSRMADGTLLTSAVYIFCTGDTITITANNAITITPTLTSPTCTQYIMYPNLYGLPDTQNERDEAIIGIETPPLEIMTSSGNIDHELSSVFLHMNTPTHTIT